VIDTHAHLDEEAFRGDCDEVVQSAAAHGVEAIVTIGTTAETSRNAVALAARFPSVYAAVGIQPNYAAQAHPGDWDEIVRLAESPKVVAIGETGLDRYWDYAPIDLQQDYFARHLELARRLDLPFVVHCREAEADVVAALRSAADAAGAPLRGIMHSFAGDAQTARDCLALGLHISFSGMVTFPKNEPLRRVAAEVPLDRLLVETDAPYLAPQQYRGKRNEPAYVRFTVEKLAEVRGMPIAELAARTAQNARALFGLP